MRARWRAGRFIFSPYHWVTKPSAQSASLSVWQRLQAFGMPASLVSSGIGNGEAVVMPRVPLHVGGLRHVAVDALGAGALRLVEGVRVGHDERSLGERGASGSLAPHAERVARGDGLGAVRIMAVHAANAGRVHLAGEKRGELVVLIPHLAVGVEGVRLIHDGQRVVIEERIAGLEVAREFRAPGVAGRAGLDHLVARELP